MGTWRGFDVERRRVLVATAGAQVVGMVAGLLRAGARVRIVAREVTPAISDLADRGRLEVITEPFRGDHLDGTALVVTDAGPGADAVATAAADRGLLVLRVGASRSSRTSAGTGRVILVGGGPGDPGLLTVAGLDAIKEADVIATDRLAPLAALEHARQDAEIVDVGKVPRGPGTAQQSIAELLIDRARRGLTVVRFKGGDGFVFGRGGEEWQACAAAGIAVTVIPGVTSATAAPAVAGIPVTHRSLSQGFTVVSGHLPPDDPRTMINWPALARSGTTLVIMMGMANLAAITEFLIRSGMPGDTPAAVVTDGTLSSMQTVRGPVAEIADRCQQAGVGAPATAVIGAVADFDPSVA